MKKIESDFPQELNSHIRTLNSLYQLIMKQKSMLEESDLEKLFNSQTEFEKIAEIIPEQRKKLTFLEEAFCTSTEIPDKIYHNLDGLIAQINELMQKIIKLENQNYSLLLFSENKIETEINILG